MIGTILAASTKEVLTFRQNSVQKISENILLQKIWNEKKDFGIQKSCRRVLKMYWMNS